MEGKNREKFVRRRRELKGRLLKFLRANPTGFSKAGFWNEVAKNTDIKVAAHYYGISKMSNLFHDFDDMLYEKMHKGKERILLIDGYTPSDNESSDSDIQIDNVSSSAGASSHGDRAKKVKGNARTKTEMDAFPVEIPASRSSDPATGTLMHAGAPLTMIPGASRPQMSPAAGIPLVQQPFVFLQPSFVQSTAQQLQVQQQSQMMAMNEQSKNSQSGYQFSDLKRFDRERMKLKENLKILLKDHYPQGIKKTLIWSTYFEVFHQHLEGKKFGVAKLSNVLHEFHDILEFPVIDDIPYVKLKNLQPSKLPWGSGMLPPQMKGLNTAPRQRTSSMSSVDSGSNASEESFMSGWGTPTVKTNSKRPKMEGEFIDLTDDGQRRVATSSQIIDLTSETKSKEEDFISFDFSKPVQKPDVENLMDRYLGGGASKSNLQSSSLMPGINRNQLPLLPSSSSGGHQPLLPLPIDLLSARSVGASDVMIDLTDPVKQINKEKFVVKEVHVPPIRAFNNRRPPTKDQVNEYAQECIDALSEANEHVSSERVEALLSQRFGVRYIRDLNVNGLRFIDQLNCVNELNRSAAKVNAYIQAFIKVRSICTLHEILQCLLEFAPDKEHFSSFKFGPFQRLPIVYQMFKFPTDMVEIPAITSMDILEHLRTYMSKYNKWTERLVMEEFMNFLVETYGADNAYVLGVRIRSLPLAAQVLKKAQRDVGQSRRSIVDGMRENLKQDIYKVFHKFRMSIIQTGANDQQEVRRHYLQLSPEVAIKEIFNKFNLIVSLEQPSSKLERRRHAQYTKAVNEFLHAVEGDRMGTMLFHLAICISNSLLDESAMEVLAPPEQEKTPVASGQQDRQPPRRGDVVENLKKYLERCLAHGALKLTHLDMIEEKLMENFEFPSFSAMGFGRFLQFLLKEAKTVLEDCGGTSIGSGSGGGEGDSIYKPQQTDVLEFLLQCMQCGHEQNSDLESALCQQFGVKEVKQLGLGNIGRLRTAAEKPGKHVSKDHCVLYEAALLTGDRSSKGQVGILGHQSREAALACLHNTPLLEDMAAWSQWSLVFEPQHGKLKDFVQKFGGVHTSNIEGGKKLMITDILALETQPGKLLKLVSGAAPEKFEMALIARDVTATCGMLLSMMVVNKGVSNMPLALLSNHVKTALFSMHASDTSSQGAPLSVSNKPQGEAVKFVLACLGKLPVRSCVSLADKIFFEPLGHVVGSTKSKSVLWESCQGLEEQNRLQELGCLLGINEWTRHIASKCCLPSSAIEEVPVEEAAEFFCDLDEEKEESEESEDEEESSDESAILSSDDDEDDTPAKQPDDDDELIVLDELSEEEEDEEHEKEDKTEKKSEATADDSESGEKTSEEDEETELTEEEKVAKKCQTVVDNIRRDEFGIGVALNEDGERLMKVHQERLGRSLDRLSKDLYSKDTHFVLELIQNADDNSYPDFSENKCPSCEFVMKDEAVIILNNESGFEERNIRALCDVGKSTKGKHKFGYIGQKGIGFKSVFRVTDRPEVHSNGYHICFDAKSGPMGYILPHWRADEWTDGDSWMTKIVLPLKEESNSRSLAARFNDIHPSLLLFLHRLRQITVQNQVESSQQTMRRRDLGKNVVEIEHNDGTDRFLVVKKSLDASKISLQTKSGVEVESSEIALAFPLRSKGQHIQTVHPRQPVFAFLPLRSYGFRFIIQGDFDVPSSREDVDRDSPWNQWIRNEIHTLFIESLEVFKAHQGFKMVEAVTTFLQFVPMEDEILDFFRPVSSQILQKLKAKPCIPTQPNSKGMISWKIPSQTVTVKDSLIRDVVTPEVLQKHLNLFYIHRDVAEALNPTLTNCLGIECLTTDHLLQIGKALSAEWEKEEQIDLHIVQTAKWLACIYRSLDEFHDNQTLIDTLKSMKIIPLPTGQYVSIADNTIFFPLTEDKKAPMTQSDPLMVLQADLNTVHPLLTATSDNEVNSQVVKLLNKLGVCHLSPQEVINHHIIPTLKSDDWQKKRKEILISYVVYLKENVERQSSLVNFEELASIVKLVTSHGVKNPKEDAIHFSLQYGNKLDLRATFPGYDWIMLDDVYMRHSQSPKQWCDFMTKLGVTNFLCMRQTNVEITDETIKESPWAPLAEFFGPLSTDTYIQDFTSHELVGLIQENARPDVYQQQMRCLFELLNGDWDRLYSQYTSAHLRSGDHRNLRDTETSFSILLRTYSWLPARKTDFEKDSDGYVRQTTEVQMMPPSCIYRVSQPVQELLAHTVMYLDANFQQNSNFSMFLQLKHYIAIEEVKDNLIKWGKRQNLEEPAVFFTSLKHIKTVYTYLQQNLPPKQAQDLIVDHQVIFVPLSAVHSNDIGSPEILAGKFLHKKEVWWNDKSGLFKKHKILLKEYHMDLANKEIINMLYIDSQAVYDLFKAGKIPLNPSLEEYGELLVFLTSVLMLDKAALTDVLKLYENIGLYLRPISDHQELATSRMIQDTEKKKLLSCLKGKKVFATKKGVWASMEDKPMIADNKVYEKFFKDKNVFFLLLEDKTTATPRGKNMRGNESKSVDMELVNLFLDVCDVKNVSDLVQSEVLTEMFQPCPKLQLYLHHAVPLIQEFICTKSPAVYQEHKDDKITETLVEMQFVQVGKLEVKYWIQNLDNVAHIQAEKCRRCDSTFYFHKDHLGSFRDINKEISKFFSRGDEPCDNSLRAFLNEIAPILTGQSHDSIDEILEDHGLDYLPEGEEPWFIPSPIIPVPQEPVIEEVPVSAEEVPTNTEGESDKPREGGNRMMSWPPMSDAVVDDRAPRKKANKDENSGESKVWPPPKAPDYLRSVKQLPAQFKVTGEESDDKKEKSTSSDKDETGSVSGASRTSDSGRSKQGGAGTGTGAGTDGSTKIYSRQNSDEAGSDGLKRKRADDSCSEGVESKRMSSGFSDESQKSQGQTTPSANQSEQQEGGMPANRKSGQTQEGEKEDGGGAPKRKLPIGEDGSPPPPTSKKSALLSHFGAPVWTEFAGEYVFEELGCGANLTVPKEIVITKADSDAEQIGRWGEFLVYNYLLQCKEENQDIMNIVWNNENEERGMPYDFEIHAQTEAGLSVLYIEVKSTMSNKKEVVEISAQQLKFAQEMREKFQIYRIFNAGDPINVKLVRVDNLSQRLDKKEVRLCMLI